MTPQREPESFLPLSHMALHVLLALGSGPSHGYAVGKDAEQRTGGKMKPTTGGLYLALRRLRDDALVVHTSAPDGESTDSRRQYFGLTPLVRAKSARLLSVSRRCLYCQAFMRTSAISCDS